MAINKYSTGQTIPNTKPGGFSSDLIKDWYHKSSPVFDDDRPPRIRASKTKKIHLIFYLAIYLFLKNLLIVSAILPNKFEPLGLASM